MIVFLDVTFVANLKKKIEKIINYLFKPSVDDTVSLQNKLSNV